MVPDTAISDSYDRTTFNALNEFEDARERLAKERDKIPRLGDVICEYGLHDVLGVSLLHKHFPLFDGEQIVKRFDRDENMAVMYPTRQDPAHQAYMYAITERFGDSVYEPVEFFPRSSVADELPALADVVEGEEEFLRHFAETAVELGVSDLFGLTVRHLELLEYNDDNEMTVERTDHEKRLLTIAVEDRADVNPDTTTETLWVFEPELGGTPESVTDREFPGVGPVQDCTHTCSHSCTHTCNHTCTHSDASIPIETLPDDIGAQLPQSFS
jgi:hypothetical protein